MISCYFLRKSKQAGSCFVAYVLQVKVKMELEIQQYEKAKAMREEQLDRLTQICQEQAVCSFTLFISLSGYSCMQPAEGSKVP